MVISTKGTLYKILSRIESLSDEILIDIAVFLKTAFSVVVFLGVVVLWDSLPSQPPIDNVVFGYRTEHRDAVTVDSTKRGQGLLLGAPALAIIPDPYAVNFSMNFSVQREIPYIIEYEIVSHDGYTLREHDNVNNNETTRIDKHFILPTAGKWCVLPTIMWDQGLSVRQHSTKLAPTCFEV